MKYFISIKTNENIFSIESLNSTILMSWPVYVSKGGGYLLIGNVYIEKNREAWFHVSYGKGMAAGSKDRGNLRSGLAPPRWQGGDPGVMSLKQIHFFTINSHVPERGSISDSSYDFTHVCMHVDISDKSFSITGARPQARNKGACEFGGGHRLWASVELELVSGWRIHDRPPANKNTLHAATRSPAHPYSLL